MESGRDRPIEGLKSMLLASVKRNKCNEYLDAFQAQQDAVNMVFTAYEEKQPLTVELIKQFHHCVTPKSSYLPDREPEQASTPGQVRKDIASTRPSSGEVTERGLLEIVKMIKSEKDFPDDQGTWIGPRNPKTYRLDSETAYYQPRLAKIKMSEDQIAKKLYSQSQKDTLILRFPCTNDTNISINNYMEAALQKLIDEFIKEIRSDKQVEKIFELIVKFIKSCLRLRPFDDLNHSVFVLCVLNFLLLSANIGICPLEERKRFTFNHLSASATIVHRYLVHRNDDLRFELSNTMSNDQFIRVLNSYKSTSLLARLWLFNRYRSGAIRELRELAKKQPVITGDQIEDALLKDKYGKERLQLFQSEDATLSKNKSTDSVILALAQEMRRKYN